MKPSQVTSAVVAVLLLALGVAVNFSTLFPANIITIVTVLIGVGGALATRLLPPFLPSTLPPHVEKVLSQINGSALAVLALLAATPAIPPSVQPWVAFFMALAGAIGTSFLQNEPNRFARGSVPAVPPPPSVPPPIPKSEKEPIHE